VVIVNAAKVKLTGRKEEQKLYRYHSGYEGGLREERAKDVRQKNPVRMVEEAVRGMLPKTKLGDAMWRKLKVYAGPDHPHAAQKPQAPDNQARGRITWQQQFSTTARAAGNVDRPRVPPAGHGGITVNRKPARTGLPHRALRTQIKQPLAVTETADKFDVLATIAGGGIAGQAGALRLGIARALVEYNLELRPRLKKDGFLTRDARIKERKKYGQKGARKRFQFSKR
jgi:small subunit ribosomal protein S9